MDKLGRKDNGENNLEKNMEVNEDDKREEQILDYENKSSVWSEREKTRGEGDMRKIE